MKIIHRRTQEIIAEGELGRVITPYPLLPFTWFRTSIPRNHEELVIVEDEGRER